MGRIQRVAGALAEAAGRAVASLPGLLAMACAVAGVFVMWGLGWALLAAVPFLLAADRKVGP